MEIVYKWDDSYQLENKVTLFSEVSSFQLRGHENCLCGLASLANNSVSEMYISTHPIHVCYCLQ